MRGLRSACTIAVVAALCITQSASAQRSNGLSHELDEAEKKLDADIKACRPIDVNFYFTLQSQATSNYYAARQAEKAGMPIDPQQVVNDSERATRLLERAQAAAQKPCPPPKQSQTSGNGPPNPPPPPPPPTNPVAPGAAGGTVIKDPFGKLEDEADDALDDLDDAMDDCDMAAVQALIPKLEELSSQAHAYADAARAAGQFSKIDPKEADALAKDLDDAIADAKKFKCVIRRPKGYRPLPINFSPFDQRILYIHNQERTAWHVPELKWNFKLEWNAIGYADHLAQIHELVHAPREGRGIERENLLQALPGWSVDRMMQSWTMEKRNFSPGYYPNVALDGNWLNVSHYTQMIWPTTTDIGCGYAEGGGYGWLVCRYSPGGNKDGKPVGLPYPTSERG